MHEVISTYASDGNPEPSGPSLSNNLRVALEAAAAGVPVFPCRESGSGAKKPRTSHGKDDATTDIGQIREWWSRYPGSLAGAPTGSASGFWVLDIDRQGLAAFPHLLCQCGCDCVEDFSPVWAGTPSGGLHVYFAFDPGTTPRTRSSDIAGGIDTRGLGGYVILPGSVLPDGRAYRMQGTSLFTTQLPQAPRSLLYLATFNAKERAFINETPILRNAVKSAAPEEWASVLQGWRDAETKRIASRSLPSEDEDGMRRQALHDLRAVAVEFAALSDGRRQKLYSLACRVARYVVHKKLTENEFRSALMDAARANGALAKHGPAWAVTTIRSAIVRASNDPLPPLARVFRSQAGA